MEDKEIMEGLLMSAKGVCDLYMHGTIESGTENVRQAFNTALDDSMSMARVLNSILTLFRKPRKR